MSVIFFLMSIRSMSYVGFKKCLFRPVDFKGKGPPGVVSCESLCNSGIQRLIYGHPLVG